MNATEPAVNELKRRIGNIIDDWASQYVVEAVNATDAIIETNDRILEEARKGFSELAQKGRAVTDNITDNTTDGVDSTTTQDDSIGYVTSSQKRVVRTKNSGDRVYLLDDLDNSRRWVTSAEILEKLGFSLSDVSEVSDADLLKYKMSSAIYSLDD